MGRWWPIVCPPDGTLRSRQKGCIMWSSTWAAAGINLSLVVHQVTTGTLDAISQGLPDTVPRAKGINLVALYIILRVWHTCTTISDVLYLISITYTKPVISSILHRSLVSPCLLVIYPGDHTPMKMT